MEIPKKLKAYFQELLYSGKKGGIVLKIDDIRSQDGAYRALVSAGTHRVYTVKSGKKFLLDTLILNNDEVSTTTYIFYDGTGTTTPVFKITLGANESVIITGLKGIEFDNYIYIDPSAYTTGGQVRIGGLVVDE